MFKKLSIKSIVKKIKNSFVLRLFTLTSKEPESEKLEGAAINLF